MYIQGPRHCAPARPAYLGEKSSIQTFSITDIYIPRVRPLGEWFHVSSVLWEFERSPRFARLPTIIIKNNNTSKSLTFPHKGTEQFELPTEVH
jgi:hypothetical protein